MRGLAEETRWLDATEQASLVRSGQVTAAELLEAAIERIEALDPPINAVVMRWFDHARKVAAGSLPDGPFRGVPFLLKDWLAAYAGMPISNGNRILKEAARPSPADSTLVSRFRAAGLVVAGRTNTPEFAGQATTEPEAWGATHNPWNLAYSTGGSSGGAAAAVAAGMVPFAHATDGAGSIRIPAGCCGLVGLKPSQGRITAGPFGEETGAGVELCVSRTVRDTAALLEAVQGPGVGDLVTAPPYPPEAGGALRVGVLDCYPGGDPVHPDCAHAVSEAARLLEDLGHHIECDHPAALDDPSIGPRIRQAGAGHIGLSLAKVADVLGRDVGPGDVERFTWIRAEWSRSVTAFEQAEAASSVAAFRRAVHQWWADGHDLLLTPTTALPPAPLGEAGGLSLKYIALTQPFNITGQPAISLPLHWNADGLPIGVQLVGAYGREDLLLKVAAQLESARPWAQRRPA